MTRHASVPALTDRLNAVATEIASAADLVALEEAVVRLVAQTVALERLCLFAHDPATGGLTPIASGGACESPRAALPGHGDMSRPMAVFESGRVLIVTGEAAALAFAEEQGGALRTEVRAMACIPLDRAGVRRGVLGVASGDPYAFSDDNLALLSFIGALACATQRRLVESGASGRGRLLEAIFQEVRAGIMLVDAKTFRIAEVNETAATLLGRRRDEIVGTRCRDFACAGRACPLRGTSARSDGVPRDFRRADGRTIAVLQSTRPMVLGGRDYYLESFIEAPEERVRVGRSA